MPCPTLPAPAPPGSFSNLYKGFYCGQEVAVKILKDLQDDVAQYNEFLQEVSIMRKVGGVGVGGNWGRGRGWLRRPGGLQADERGGRG
jgi:hypothetical protein